MLPRLPDRITATVETLYGLMDAVVAWAGEGGNGLIMTLIGSGTRNKDGNIVGECPLDKNTVCVVKVFQKIVDGLQTWSSARAPLP